MQRTFDKKKSVMCINVLHPFDCFIQSEFRIWISVMCQLQGLEGLEPLVRWHRSATFTYLFIYLFLFNHSFIYLL